MRVEMVKHVREVNVIDKIVKAFHTIDVENVKVLISGTWESRDGKGLEVFYEKEIIEWRRKYVVVDIPKAGGAVDMKPADVGENVDICVVADVTNNARRTRR